MKIHLDWKEMKERDRINDEKYVEFRDSILDELMVERLKPNIKDTLINKEGTKLDSGLYFVFRINDEELRVYCYYDEIVVSESQRSIMVEEAKRTGKKVPNLGFKPTHKFRLIYLQGISNEKPSSITTVRLDEAKSIVAHPFFKSNFK